MNTRTFLLNFITVFAALALGTMIWVRAAAPASAAVTPAAAAADLASGR